MLADRDGSIDKVWGLWKINHCFPFQKRAELKF